MAYEFPSATYPIEAGYRDAESHLNALKEVTSAIIFGWWMHNRVWDENSTGAISYAPQNDDSLKTIETGTPSMQVTVQLGAGFLAGVPFRKTGDTTIAALTAPTTDPRIDTLGIDPTDGSVIVYPGTEAASPSAPSVATGIFKACEVYLRVGSTAIYDTAQSTGGYIQNLCSVFSLPADGVLDSGATVSGGAFVFDGTSGDITLPADGLSMEFDYAGENDIDATDAAGYLVLRTGGSTDRLTLGIPGDPITLHGSSHDNDFSGDGKTLTNTGAAQFTIKQTSGTGIALQTGATKRYDVNSSGLHTFYGSSGNISIFQAGNKLDFSYGGTNFIRATDASGIFEFHVNGESGPRLSLAAIGMVHTGDANTTTFEQSGAYILNSGATKLRINQSGATDGLVLQTGGTNRYGVNAAGLNTFYGTNGDITIPATGDIVACDYAGEFAVKATDAAGTLALYAANAKVIDLTGDDYANVYGRIKVTCDENSTKNAGVEAHSFGDFTGELKRGSFNAEAARGTVATPTIVQDDDVVLRLLAKGYDGNSYESLARVDLLVDGTPGDGDMPGQIAFYTTPDGSATSVYRGGFRADGTLESVYQARYSAQAALATTGAVSWSLLTQPSAKMSTLTGNVTLTINDIAQNYEGYLYVKQDGATAYTITWPATVKWADGTAPDISTLDSEHLLSFFSYDGTNVVAAVVSNFS